MAGNDAISGAPTDAVYVNQQEGLSRVLNNAKLYVRLLTKFKTETTLDELNAAVKAGDFEKAQVDAHTLKGIAANLSLTKLFLQIQDLEIRIKKREEVSGDLEKLGQCFSETIINIDKVIEQYG
jgi:HPt (histidine-containing phosphotransfer) domain-containing protein